MGKQRWVPNKVHLVGSIGLDTVQDVFHTCGTVLGDRLKRLPDGEPGGRRMWCSWQAPLLRANPFLKVAPGQPGPMAFGPLMLADESAGEQIRFGELGYALEARTSYQDLLNARLYGYVSPSTRFQVSLPTPLANIFSLVTPESYPAVERAYTAAMLREVQTIRDAIPHRDLCIQWDVCFEMCMWDGGGSFRWTQPGDARAEIIRRLKQISDPIPPDVELGFHLCYGDLDAQHFFNPKDAAAMVSIANAIAAAVARPITYFHMPVPIDRDDDAFFRPFDELNIGADTEIYLGVVHAQDGLPGLERRIAAARGHIADFGIATECGMARARTPDVVRRLLEIHAAGTRNPSAAPSSSEP
jgi:methionine synthase II (cobalamin-independent)